MPSNMKFILVPVGSAGDVHPFIWLAKILKQRGHDVSMIAQAFVAHMPRAAGITTLSTGNPTEQESILNHPDLWHPRRAIKLLSRYMPLYAREQLPIISQEIRKQGNQDTILIAGSLAFGARIASERWGNPLLTVHLQPSVMMSAEDPPVMFAHGEWFPKSPLWVRKSLFAYANWDIDRRLAKPINQLRREIGITTPPVTGIFKTWWHSPDAAVCLFPDWYAPQAHDWPPQTIMTRFPLYDESQERPFDPLLEEFILAGDEPIVITPGSANNQASRFIHNALEACAHIGRRALIVTRFPQQVKSPLPEWAKVFEYIPFSRIFPSAAAVIHHGGIGTTAQCLAAGTPQLIMPMAHDQPDNANRITRFGAGDFLYPSKFTPKNIAKKLEALIGSPPVLGACAKMRTKMRRQLSESAVAELLETTAERTLRVRQINGPGVPA